MGIETCTANDAEELYGELKWMLQRGLEEETRGGRVMAMPTPVYTTLKDPRKRVVADVARDANPFFHLLETVWMFAGRNDVHWLLPFNKRMKEFAEDTGVINGTYGFRWRYHWKNDQLIKVAECLRRDPGTRRAVIAMWDPDEDLHGRRDQPCNTHCYFRTNSNMQLDMTVCNRSNDLVWGMCGANIVHLTYMHEFVALAAGLEMGEYHVFTNNLHIYERHWPLLREKHYEDYVGVPMPLEFFSTPQRFLDECELFCNAPESQLSDPWITGVVQPAWLAHKAYRERAYKSAFEWAADIAADDWRQACQRWLVRRFPFLETAPQSNDTTQSE